MSVLRSVLVSVVSTVVVVAALWMLGGSAPPAEAGSPAFGAQGLINVTPCGVFDSRPNQGGTGKFTAGQTRDVQLEATAACPEVPAEADGFLISVIAINGEGLGSVKVWPASEPEPAAGGVLASVSSPAAVVTPTRAGSRRRGRS